MPPGLEPPREGGGPNPPYGEDYFQRIGNVHWGSVTPIIPEVGITILLPSVEPNVVFLSSPIIRRTVLRDGLNEFES